MISGADDRLAFVIDTEARLDGIKAARKEVVGLGADTRAMGGAYQGASINLRDAEARYDKLMGVTSGVTDHTRAMTLAQIEAIKINEKMGQGISLTSSHVGRLREGLASAVAQMAGVPPIATRIGSTVGVMTLGMGAVVPALAAIGATLWVFDKLTESSRKAMEVSDKLVESYVKLARVSALGFGGQQKADIEDINKGLEQHAKWLGALIELRIRLGGLGGLVPGIGGHAEALGSGATALAAAQQKLLNERGLQDAKDNDAFAKRIKDANDKATTEADRQAAVQLRIATGMGTAATQAVDKMLAEQEKAQLKATEAEARGTEMHAEMQAKALELTLQSLGKETEAKLAANDAEYMRRQQDIANLDVTEKRKTELLRDNANLRVATEAQIRDAAADKDEKARLSAEAKIVAAEKRKEQIMLHSIDAYVKSSASLQKILIQAALAPLVKELEGTAVRQFVRASASFAAGDYGGAARHAAAGVLATAGAHEVAQLGEMAGGGGSSSGGGSAGGGGSSSTTFEPRSATEGQGMVTINLLSANPYGPEQIQQVQYQLQRADILKRPIPISPTNRLVAA
jgi:hypothetical protein